MIIDSGVDLSLSVELIDGDGAIPATAVSFALYDGDNLELIPLTRVATFNIGDYVVQIPINQSFNKNLATSYTLKSRWVKVVATLSTGSKTINRYYSIKPSSPLSLMFGSYQTMQEAESLVSQLTNMDYWNAATEDKKINAMVESFERLGRLAYSVSGYFEKIENLNDLSQEAVTLMPSKFLKALKRAQLFEANEILLDASGLRQQREDGLVSETVGESSKTWKNTPTVKSSVSKRALNELSSYLNFGVRKIGRC